MEKNKYNTPSIRMFVYRAAEVLCASETGLSSSIEVFSEERNYSGETKWY